MPIAPSLKLALNCYHKPSYLSRYFQLFLTNQRRRVDRDHFGRVVDRLDSWNFANRQRGRVGFFPVPTVPTRQRQLN